MGFCALGLQFEQHRLGLWDLRWDLKNTISWEMGLGPPLHDPQERTSLEATAPPYIEQRPIIFQSKEKEFFPCKLG